MSSAKFAVFLLLQLFCICAGSHIEPPSNVRVSKAVSNGPALNVTWEEPSGTSRTVYGYHVRYRRVTSVYISWANPLQTRGRYNTSYTIEGLLPGTSYAVSVRTIHDSGSTYSPYATSQPSRVTTFNVPSEVTGVRLSGVSTQAALRVTWTKPSSDSNIIQYYVQYGPSPAKWTVTVPVQGADSLTTTLTGLGRRSYDVRVRAVSYAGLGLYSATSTLSTARVPSRVTGVRLSVVSGQTDIKVTWTKPSSDRPIIRYHVQYGPNPSHPDRWANTIQVQGADSLTTTLTGLGRRSYDVRVSAESDAGAGLYSLTSTQKVPSHVTGVMLSVVSGQAAIKVTWTKPSSDRPIIRYDVQYGPSPAHPNRWSRPIPVQGANALTTTLTGLRRKSYDVRVRAVSYAGLGWYSPTSTLSTARVPSQVSPPTVTETVSSGKLALTVSWREPDSDRPITKYELLYRNTSDVRWTSSDVMSRTHTLPNLDAGIVYRFKVRAVSDLGNGLLSEETKQTTSRVPPQVTGVRLSIVSGQASIRVNWNKPSVDATFIIYDLQYKLNSQSWGASLTRQVTGNNQSYVTVDLTALQRGTTYNVRVRAVSNAGNGNYSAEATSTVPYVPSEVTGVSLSVVSGQAAIRVNWTKPSSDLPIIRYEVEYGERGVQWIAIVAVPGADTMTTTITKLHRGTTYVVRVRAVSAAGEGIYTEPQRRPYLILPRLPTQVTGVSLSVVSGQAALRVTWNQPSIEGTFIRYDVVQYKRSSQTWNAAYTTEVNGNNIVTVHLPGLQRGTTYNVRVRAVSNAGNGPYSTEATSTVPRLPSQVNGLKLSLVSGQASIRVTWDQPISDRPIIRYDVDYGVSGVSFSSTVIVHRSHSLRFTITGLTRGTGYVVRVRAVSDAGNGPYSDTPPRRTIPRLPSTISTPTVTQFLSSGGPVLRVSWSRPISELTISRYDFVYKLRTSTEWTVRTLKGRSSTSTVIPNVEQSMLYNIGVRAISQAGKGVYSNTTGYYYRVPSAPVLTSVQPVVSSNSVGLTVQWTPNTSERPITSYDVEYRSSFGKPRWELRTVEASTTTTTFDSLEKNTTYRVRVAATSDVGTGPPSAEKEAITFGVPALDEVCAYPLPKPGSVRMAWTRANFTQPSMKLQSYSIQYRKVTEQGGSADFKEQLFNSTSMVVSVGDTVSAEVHGLNLGDVYDVKVALLTNAGIGEYSELVNVTTYPDSCSQCSEIRAVTFVMFQADRMKVSEEQSMVLVDVYRQGPMETPLTLRVKDIPGTANRGSDYLLQSRDVVFLNTDQRLEKTSIVVRIRNDEVVEQGSPESFTLVLYSDDVDSRVVFTVSEVTITIKDDD